MAILLVGIIFSFLGAGLSQTPDTAENIQARLYTVLHDLALPNFNPDNPVSERFILLVPGEVLDYHDYAPLDGKIKIHDFNRLPPDENQFRLSDTVLNVNPLGGGITGKSLSRIYEEILYSLDTSRTGADPFSKATYTDSINWLKEEVVDPEVQQSENETVKVSRFELYYKYKQEYYRIKELVKTWLDSNRTQIANLEEYEIWYQENYDSLVAWSMAAYEQWIVNGLKGEKIALVDIKSISQVVEEARQALQIEERPSMDGGSKYYPVHIIPSNWYEYLKAR